MNASGLDNAAFIPVTLSGSDIDGTLYLDEATTVLVDVGVVPLTPGSGLK